MPTRRLRTVGHQAVGQTADQFIALLRHGDTAGGDRFRGRHDDPLSELGWHQVIGPAEHALHLHPRIGRIITSSARRCAEPARRLSRACELRLDLVDEIAERRFGAWEGCAAERIPATELEQFWADPSGYTPPGAEPFADFRARVITAWHRICAASGADTLVITHGGVIRVILADLLSTSDPSGLLIEVPPGCLTRIRVPPRPGLPSLISHGAVQ